MNGCGYIAGVLHDPTSKVPSTPRDNWSSVCGDRHRDALETDAGQGVGEPWGKRHGIGLIVRPSRFLGPAV